MNKIILIGNVGQVPEFKYFDSGAFATNFTLAVRRYVSKDKTTTTDWFNVQTFSKLGEYIKKGQRIAVEGEMHNIEYEKDGEKKHLFRVFAQNVEILEKKETENPTSETNTINTEEVPF